MPVILSNNLKNSYSTKPNVQNQFFLISLHLRHFSKNKSSEYSKTKGNQYAQLIFLHLLYLTRFIHI